MRRVITTPTFAAGLGVVIAAALASTVTRNVLRYHGPSDTGQPCAVAGCIQPGSGQLASAKPGKRLVSPAHSASPETAGQGGQAGADPAANVVVRYQTVRETGSGDFYGEIVLISRNGHELGRWTFQFTYPSAQITSVWAGTPVPHGAHVVTVTAGQYPNGSSQQMVQIAFSVAGPAGPPVGCSFDGHSCQYVVGQDPHGGYPGGPGRGGGGYQGGSGYGN